MLVQKSIPVPDYKVAVMLESYSSINKGDEIYLLSDGPRFLNIWDVNPVGSCMVESVPENKFKLK